MTKKIVQYEVWKECHNHCKFCFLAGDTRFTSKEVKLDGIKNARDSIVSDVTLKKVTGVGLIGGDFWQGELVDEELKKEFFDLLKLCFSYLKEGAIEEVWLTATLTIGDQKYLYEALDLYKNMISDSEQKQKRLWVCTSYDTIGRFHTEQNLKNWEEHMIKITNEYPTVLKNTSFIITNDLVKKTNSDNFNFAKFKQKFNTEIYLKTPCHHLEIPWAEGKKEFNKIVGDFFLERVPTILFLQKLNEEFPEALEKIMNNDLRADVLVGHSNNGNYDLMIRDRKDSHRNICTLPKDGVEKAEIQNCGHEKHYQCYIDSEKCFMCDLLKIFKVL